MASTALTPCLRPIARKVTTSGAECQGHGRRVHLVVGQRDLDNPAGIEPVLATASGRSPIGSRLPRDQRDSAATSSKVSPEARPSQGLPPLLQTARRVGPVCVVGVGAHARALRERPASRALSIYAYVVVRQPLADAAPVLAEVWGSPTTISTSGFAA